MRTKIRWLFRALAIVAALLATIQPVFGSFALFRGGDPAAYEDIHLVVGGILYNLALLLTLLVLFIRGSAAAGPSLPSALCCTA